MDTQKMPEPEGQSERARRPYERPAVLWEEDFMPYAFSTCNEMPGQGGVCTLHQSS